MLLAIITIHPQPGDEAKIIDVLDSMRGLVATNAECLGCVLTVEAGAGRAIFYMERWRTREALVKHLASNVYCRVLEAMELSRIPPEVEFLDVREVGGLELVEKARSVQSGSRDN
jgi:quinol monooxygenase YgiN